MARNQLGFTLIELLIVVSLSVMLMLTASAAFMTFLLGNTKTTSTQLLRDEGKYSLSQMEFLLRNALLLLPNTSGVTCSSGMTEIRFKNYDNGITTLFSENGKIASNSGVYLTSASVELSEGPIFDCVQSDDGIIQYVTVTFKLRKGTPGFDQAKEITEQEFTGAVSLRSY